MIGIMFAALAMLPGGQQSQGETAKVEIGRWLIQPEGATRCHMLGAIDDTVVLSFAEDAKTWGSLAVFGQGWQLETKTYAGSYSWDGWKTSMPVDFKALPITKTRGLLVIGTDAVFTQNLLRAKHFWLRVPELNYDGDVDIPEVQELVAALAACNQRH
ncbi:MAG: hypothetical protein ABI240_08770 [Sphingomonas sp.]